MSNRLDGGFIATGVISNDAVEPFALGNTTVTWTIEDGSGNIYLVITSSDYLNRKSVFSTEGILIGSE